MKVRNSIAACLNVMMLIFLQSQAAEPSAIPEIDKQLANKVILYNDSGYPIEVKTSDPNIGFRLANRTYQLIGANINDVLERNLFLTVGHSSVWLGSKETKGYLDLAKSIIDAQKKGYNKPGTAFRVLILEPSKFIYSSWQDSIKTSFALPSAQITQEQLELPKNGDPYDIQDLKGVKKEAGGTASIEGFKSKTPIRWARLVLALPKDYTRVTVRSHYNFLVEKYSGKNYPRATKADLELLRKVKSILDEAASEAAINVGIKE